MDNPDFLNRYETLLSDGLLKLCRGAGLIDGSDILDSPDISAKWDEYLKEYVADAVENFNDYPQTAIAWAGFLGLGVATLWDKAFEVFKTAPYSAYYGSRGYDDMDEHILHDILKLELDSAEAVRISDNFSSLALAALALIRHEGIEAQTSQGFYILVRTYQVLFRLGATIGLRRLGYRKILLNQR